MFRLHGILALHSSPSNPMGAAWPCHQGVQRHKEEAHELLSKRGLYRGLCRVPNTGLIKGDTRCLDYSSHGQEHEA